MKKFTMVMTCLLAMAGIVFANGATENGSVAPEDRYPERSITLVCPAKTGGDMDQISRVLASALTKKLGVSVVVQNMGENGGNAGVQYALKQDPDGYTYVLFNGIYFTGIIANKFDPAIDNQFEIALTAAKADNQILVVDAKSDITTPKSMAEKIKMEPGTVKFAATLGSPSQFHAVATEKAMDGKFKKVDVASGSSKLVALLSGEVDVVSSTQSLVKDYVTKGQIAIVGSICSERSALYPDTPTFKEEGYDLGPDFAATYMILAKKGTNPAFEAKFAQGVADVMQDPEILEQLKGLGYTPAVRVGQEAVEWKSKMFDQFNSMAEAIHNDKW